MKEKLFLVKDIQVVFIFRYYKQCCNEYLCICLEVVLKDRLLNIELLGQKNEHFV